MIGEQRKKQLNFLTSLYKKQLGKIIFSVFLTICNTIAGILTPLIIMYFIDKILPQNDMDSILEYSLYVLLFYITYTLCVFSSYLVEGKIVFNSNFQLRKEAISLLNKLKIQKVKSSNNSGEMTQLITQDIPMCQSILFSSIVPLVMQVTSFFIIFGVIYQLHAPLSMLLCLFIPLYFINYWVFNNKIVNANEQILYARDECSTIIQNINRNYEMFKLANKDSVHHDSYLRNIKKTFNAQNKSGLLYSSFLGSTSLIQSLTLMFVLIYGGYSVITNTISIGSYVAICMYITKFFSPIDTVLRLYIQLNTSLLAVNRVMNFWSIEKEFGDREELNFNNGEVYIKQYQNPSFSVVDLSFLRGDLNVLIGKNGIGKTSLVNSLIKLHEIPKNKIFIDGTDIYDVNPEKIRRNIYISFQTPQFLGNTISTQLQHARKRGSYRNMDETILRKIDNEGIMLISSLEKNKDLNDFSGGERQLISIATGIVSKPEILILDESFSNLDFNKINEVMDTLKRISSYITIIIVTHDQNIIKEADRVVNLSQNSLSSIS
ncbi:ABC transporter transmembrane domain-containing protein [Bacillus sp. CHD6a]|uniref:ABC transporter transmembrane domain-containing protein n=1 Tax=Bacillus sp. CHD6a TaxID=1643452 RepID=UPI0006CDE846|nr:ABC transporter ATP-binding protein [Bacillus sp. CHD6a]KPB05723.1 hypothetical protein AAV98_05420 [Bacillus sp. CHD6a]